MNIKITSRLFCVFFCLAGTAQAQQSPISEKTQDFAYGLPLTTESRDPFFRIELPEAVYTETVWPDMRDVRVFNSQGQSVAFALTANTITQSDSQTYSLRLFPMKSKKTTLLEQEVISLKSVGGVEIILPIDSDQQMGNAYLLEVPQYDGSSPSLTQLKLTWERQPENWQSRVSIMYSHDLNEWMSGVDDAPLMDLVSSTDRLLLNTIDLDNGRYYSQIRYLLLVFNDDQMAPGLKILSAEGIAASHRTDQQRITLPFSSKAISTSEAEYTWSNPQPLNNISVRPTQSNTVLPLEIEYRSKANDRWQPLVKRVVYSVNDRTAEAIPLKDLLVQGIRLKGINQQWNDHMPEVVAERDRKTIVFNAQGTPPFLLAWGNKAAQHQAISLDELIPAALRKSVSVKDLPLVGFQSRVILGGNERLNAMDASEVISAWKKGLLWLLLVFGAGALLLLALQVWKEVRHTPE